MWGDKTGEMSIKQIDGKAVLSYLNLTTGDMEVRVADNPTRLGTAPVTTVVKPVDWPDPAESLPAPDDNGLAQPYGGYISPGSTLDELRIFVSQWNNAQPRARAALPGHPIRGQPVQALVRRCFWGFRPQSVRSKPEYLLDEALCSGAGSVGSVRPEVRVRVQRDAGGGVAQGPLDGDDVAPSVDESGREEVSAVVQPVLHLGCRAGDTPGASDSRRVGGDGVVATAGEQITVCVVAGSVYPDVLGQDRDEAIRDA